MESNYAFMEASARRPSVARCGDAGGVTKASAPCRSHLNLGESGKCLSHDPERAGELQVVHAAGGRAAGVTRRLAKAANPDGVPGGTALVGRRVTDRKLDHARNAMTSYAEDNR